MFVRYNTTDDLSNTIAVFPLTGALLLPRNALPLNIFEPRYLAMIDDAMRGSRLIGMIQPRVHEKSTQRPPLYNVGCVGRITNYSETGDGRLLISLSGLCRYHISEELSVTTPYRQVIANYEPFADDLRPQEGLNVDIMREALLEVLRIYLDAQRMKADWDSIERAPSAQLVDTLSMICPFGPNEKQALLEATTLLERARTLITLIEMANADLPSGGSGPVQ